MTGAPTAEILEILRVGGKIDRAVADAGKILERVEQRAGLCGSFGLHEPIQRLSDHRTPASCAASRRDSSDLGVERGRHFDGDRLHMVERKDIAPSITLLATLAYHLPTGKAG
jgi:hypothetical protein